MAVIRWIRDVVVLLCMLVLGLLIAAKLEQQQSSTFSGPFWAIDGDTLSDAGERLRLSGVDAPELDQTCRREGRDWHCGTEARDRLQALVQERGLACEGGSRDKYGRLLVSCKRNGGDLGAVLVREGVAVAYGRYEREESEARAAHKGLWAGTFKRPQDFRRERGLADDEIGNSWLSGLMGWLLSSK